MFCDTDQFSKKIHRGLTDNLKMILLASILFTSQERAAFNKIVLSREVSPLPRSIRISKDMTPVPPCWVPPTTCTSILSRTIPLQSATAEIVKTNQLPCAAKINSMGQLCDLSDPSLRATVKDLLPIFTSACPSTRRTRAE
jgi:hypothetical protein